MPPKRPLSRIPLRLHQIVEELHQIDSDDDLPSEITIFPPDNPNNEVTDEDSGDEEFVSLDNLPGSQLRATAEIGYDGLSGTDDSEDDLPLSTVGKRRTTGTDCLPEDVNIEGTQVQSPSVSTPPSSSLRIPTVTPSVMKTQQYKWRNRHNASKVAQWKDREGPKNLQSPLYYFDCMISDEVIQLLVHYTNLYASQKNAVGNITPSEMRCFLAILLFSGYIVVPRRYMFWEKSSDTNFDIIYNAMSRDRFTMIMKHLHCCDNNVIRTDSDKFAKLRPLFDLLNKIFLDMAPFQENYSIDEAMVPYYGGHSCKQFIRGKPIRWGYKLWVGATRLGYVLWFDPYQGHSTNIAPCYKQFGLGASVIFSFADVLQSSYPNTQFHLFFDNFFSSIPLFHELTNRGLRATGTIRENRTSKCPLPVNNVFKKTERGTIAYKSSLPKQILVCKWNDNSVVSVASNSETIEPLHKVKRFSQQQKKYVHIDQPTVIKIYNENMGGVDRSDQNIGLYRTSIRGKKWYFSLICHGLDMATHNAWQLYKTDGGEYDHLMFRRVVARGLLESYKRTERRGPCRTPSNYRETSRYDRIDHVIEYKDVQSRCTMCKKKSNFICCKCVLYLHPKMCFIAYHKI